MLEIPGYIYDPVSNRYFKGTSRNKRPPPSFQQPKPSADQRQPQRQVKPIRLERKSLSRIQAALPLHYYDDVASSPTSSYGVTRDRLRQSILLSSFSSAVKGATEEPDLTTGDSVTCLTFDDIQPDLARYGTTYGLVGHGAIMHSDRPLGHSVSSWKADHILGNPITSLSSCNGRILTTSFGPIAQACYTTTSDSHIIGYDLPTAASPRLIQGYELGCDKKVLISPDPTKAEMRSYGTGSAVFALHQEGDELLVGTRSGHLRCFDVRAARVDEEESKAEVLLRLSTSITDIRRFAGDLILVSLINGDLNMYDRRFLPLRPQAVRTLVGNVNTCSRNLGLDVLETQILAAAGEDKRVRLWSLDTGKLVESSGAGVNLPDKVFERPI
ncbi:MAG: hypothetical protein CYPHOPRED_001958 [Cyphobasidiales sp. Tagirdzhanova-0007]|nr:MAG: hypothetical protein CYPHOPRED_001958 [Cyphobasidiales sp. Tagirdzhanova-0007]